MNIDSAGRFFALSVAGLMAGCAGAARTEAPKSATTHAGMPAPGMPGDSMAPGPTTARGMQSGVTWKGLPASSDGTGQGPTPEMASIDSTENLSRVSDAAEGADFDPALSPNGESVYFASTRHGPRADIYVKSVDGMAITQLTSHPAEDIMPAVSPDGKRLAFASNRGGSWDIYLMSTEGGQPTQLTSDAADELHPTWGPDGNSIAFCRLNPSANRWEVWVTLAANPSVRRFLTYGMFPAWQPEGNRIAFQRARDRGGRFYSIWTVQYEKGEARSPTEVASSPTLAITNPAWSREGDLLACVALAPGSDEQSRSGAEFADIWIVSADGRVTTNLTGGRHLNLSPTWGPAGSLYFVSDRSGIENIWSIQGASMAIAGGMTPAAKPGVESAMADEMPGASDEPAAEPQAAMPEVTETQSTTGTPALPGPRRRGTTARAGAPVPAPAAPAGTAEPTPATETAEVPDSTGPQR